METRTIKTKADLKRLSVGTKLRLIHTLLGPTDKPREIAGVYSRAIAMKIESGELSYLHLTGQLEPTEQGFRMIEDGKIAAEYIVCN
jgi:hypothetical protein